MPRGNSHHESSVADELRDTAAHVVKGVREKAEEYAEAGREKAHEWEEGIEGYIQEKPLHAVLMAAAIGLVLGLLWRRH